MYYKNPEISRFFAPNSSRYAPTRFFRGFRREYLTSPTPIFGFLYNREENIILCFHYDIMLCFFIVCRF